MHCAWRLIVYEPVMITSGESLFRLGVRLPARALEAHIPIFHGFLVPAMLPSHIRTFNKQVLSHKVSVR
jgi:hypothetical protein